MTTSMFGTGEELATTWILEDGEWVSYESKSLWIEPKVHDWRDAFPILYIYDELIRLDIEYEQELDAVTWTYFIAEIPPQAHESMTKELVVGGINEWQILNPNLVFEEVVNPIDAAIVITWAYNIEHEYDVMGITNSEITIFDDGSEGWYSEIIIDIGDLDCNGIPIYWTVEAIDTTVKHELGHALGIEDHSSDENNLMYDPDDGIPIINDWGYNLPLQNKELFYIGEEEAINKMEFLTDEYERQLSFYGYTIEDWDNDNVDLTDGLFVDKVNTMIEKLNPAIEISNCFLEGSDYFEERN